MTSALFIHDRDRLTDQQLAPFEPPAVGPPQGPTSTFGENLRAGFRSQQLSENYFSERSNLYDAYQPIVQAMRERGERTLNPYRPRAHLELDQRYDPEADAQRLWKQIKSIRTMEPGALADLPGSKDALEDQIKETVLAARQDFQDISRRAGTQGAIGGIVGQSGAAILDPPMLATLALGAPAAAGILRTALVEGLIGVGTEAAIQPKVASYYRELGIDYTSEDFIANVAAGGVGGAVFGGGAKAAMVVLERAFGKIKAGEELTPEERAEAANAVASIPEDQLPDIAAKAGIEVDGQHKAAMRTLGDLADADGGLNSSATESQRAAHRNHIDTATEAMETGQELPSPPYVPVTMPETVPSTLTSLRPHSIEVDAATFQFKDGGDSRGVTQRLAGVAKWDPVKAGTAIVYEHADGRMVIADGHQRLGLAQRLAAENPDQDIRIEARVLREADGITPAQARVVAAMKNIAEGSGSAVDAARVFRAAPDQIDASLPRQSAQVRHGMDLANLNPEAFGVVANGVVPEHFGALVGRLAPNDDALQTGLIKALHAMDPANATEAEAIIRQFIADRGDDAPIANLFGDQAIATSSMVQRARLVDKVIKQLRRERLVFSTLTRNAADIEAAGNVLAEGNAARADQAAQAAEIVMRLATRTGPVSEAFNAGAKLAQETGRYDKAVGNVVGAIRARVAAGDIDGLLSGQGGRGLALEAPGNAGARVAPALAAQASIANDELIEGFAEPAGAAAQAQSDGLEIDLRAVPDDTELTLSMGEDDTGQEVMETLTKGELVQRQAAEMDFLDQLQVVCRT